MSQHGYPERAAWRRGGGGKPCPGAPATIEVLVETLTGSAFEMTVSPLDTVLAIKSKIYRVEGIPISQQHLLYNLKELENSSSLQEHSIADGATLRLVLSMRGGPISMHRLPLPAEEAHWRDLKDLVESDREDSDWLACGSKVAVLLFREGDSVNMVRVLENEDGTYSPLADHPNNCPTPRHPRPGAAQENAVTMSKMLELRQRMECLAVSADAEEAVEPSSMQKTRSEEVLSSTTGLLDDAHYDEPDSFPPLLDGNYTKYDYECSFADRYTLLPPISADCSQSSSEERVGLQLAEVTGAILVKSGGDEDERTEQRRSAAKEYGPLVAEHWRVRRAFGSSSHLAPTPLTPLGPLAPALSASSLQRPPLRPPPPPLADGLFSASTSDLEQLRRSRGPGLCRHRNREHLDVSDERLDRTPATHSLEVGSERRHRRIKKIAEQRAETAFTGGAAVRHHDNALESSVRRLDNRDKLSELRHHDNRDKSEPSRHHDNAIESSVRRLDNRDKLSELRQHDNCDKVSEPSRHHDNKLLERVNTPPPPDAASLPPKKAAKVRCGFCRKRLSIATVHRCRCGGEYCAPHRYAEVHGCAYDYKAHAHQYLQRANPLVSAPKLPKI